MRCWGRCTPARDHAPIRKTTPPRRRPTSALYFCTGALEQKAANLRSNPQCVLSTGANRFHEGLDVVVEGSAVRVTGWARLEELAALWKSKLDWDFDVAEDGFRDPHSPSGEVLVFGVAPTKVLAFGKSPYSQTRYRFAG